MTWRPTTGWLIVQKLDTERQIGRIFLTDHTTEAWTLGQWEIVSAGKPPELTAKEKKKVWLRKTYPDYQPGDWVLAPERRATECWEESVWLLPMEEVFAVVKA